MQFNVKTKSNTQIMMSNLNYMLRHGPCVLCEYQKLWPDCIDAQTPLFEYILSTMFAKSVSDYG